LLCGMFCWNSAAGAHEAMCARPREVRDKRVTNERHAKLYMVFSSDESRGLRSIQSTTITRAIQHLRSGIWVERYDDDGFFLGFQIRSAKDMAEDLQSRQTAVMLTARDAVRNATDVSNTAGMTEEQRTNRYRLPDGEVVDRETAKASGMFARQLPAEDDMERLQAKIAMFTRPASRVSAEPGAPCGDRAVRVYPNC
jgi:hypothetical protein